MPWHLDGTSALRESSWPAGQAAFLMHILSEARGVLCIIFTELFAENLVSVPISLLDYKSLLCLIHGQGSLMGYSPWGHKELD